MVSGLGHTVRQVAFAAATGVDTVSAVARPVYGEVGVHLPPGASLATLDVAEGARVARGERLAHYDDAQLRAALETIRASMGARRAEAHCLMGAVFEPELFAAISHMSEVRADSMRIAERSCATRHLQTSAGVARLALELRSSEERRDVLERLVREHMAGDPTSRETRITVLNLLLAQSALDGRIGELRATMAETRVTDLRDRLARAHRLAQSTAALRAEEQRLQALLSSDGLRAPVDGTVVSVRRSYAGADARGGTHILDLRPIEVQAYRIEIATDTELLTDRLAIAVVDTPRGRFEIAGRLTPAGQNGPEFVADEPSALAEAMKHLALKGPTTSAAIQVRMPSPSLWDIARASFWVLAPTVPATRGDFGGG
ncbi:MAG: hypothetical protein ACU0CI_07580 [Shimia sp.]